jgi:hypothetical protein
MMDVRFGLIHQMTDCRDRTSFASPRNGVKGKAWLLSAVGGEVFRKSEAAYRAANPVLTSKE